MIQGITHHYDDLIHREGNYQEAAYEKLKTSNKVLDTVFYNYIINVFNYVNNSS